MVFVEVVLGSPGVERDGDSGAGRLVPANAIYCWIMLVDGRLLLGASDDGGMDQTSVVHSRKFELGQGR